MNHFRGTDDAAACADHVIEHQSDLAFDTGTDEIFLLRGICTQAAFVHDCERRAKSRGMAECRLMLPSSALTTTTSFESKPSERK